MWFCWTSDPWTGGCGSGGGFPKVFCSSGFWSFISQCLFSLRWSFWTRVLVFSLYSVCEVYSHSIMWVPSLWGGSSYSVLEVQVMVVDSCATGSLSSLDRCAYVFCCWRYSTFTKFKVIMHSIKKQEFLRKP